MVGKWFFTLRYCFTPMILAPIKKINIFLGKTVGK